MRHILLVALLVVTLIAPVAAQSGAGLPYELKLSSPLGSSWKKDELRNGSTFGGVPVTGTIVGTSTTGTITLYVDGKLFTLGRYACSSKGCLFSGSVAGKGLTAMSLTSESRLSGRGNATSGVFPTHRAWVSAVTDWANANLNGARRGQIISTITKTERPQSPGQSAPTKGVEPR